MGKHAFRSSGAALGAAVFGLMCSLLGGPQPAGAFPQTANEQEKLLFRDIPSVFSASKYEQKTTEAPSSVTIITSDEIRKFGYRTLADILRGVRGMFTTYDRNYDYIGMRGFARPGDYSTRFLLLVDGLRMNDNVYDQVSIGTDFPLDVDLIERVEIIRGPASSLYGSNAFFGVISVSTKRGRDLQGAEISGEAGSFETFKGRLSYGNKFKNGLEILLSGTGYGSRGNEHLYFEEFDDPATNNGFADGCDADKFGSVFGKLSYREWTFLGSFVDRKKTIPTAPWETVFNNPGTFSIDKRADLDLRYDRFFFGQWGLTAHAFYGQYDYDGDYIDNWAEPGAPPDLVVNRDYGRGTWWGAEFNLTRKLWGRHRLITGLEFRDNVRQDQGNYDREVYLDDRRSSFIWAAYLQDEFEILKNLKLNAGLRYDHYGTFNGTANPRLALIFNPYRNSTFKFLYGRAFRAPNAYELYYNDSTMKANPELGPEKIETREIVWEQDLGKGFRATAVGYENRIGGLISQMLDPLDGLIIFDNLDRVRAVGAEIEVEGKWSNGLQGTASFTLQRTEDRLTGEILTNSPASLAKLSMIAPLSKGRLFLSLEEFYISKRKTLDGNFAAGSWLTNMRLFGQNLGKGLELSAGVYNLFGAVYGDPGGEEHIQDVIIQNGRSFRLKLTFLF